MATYLDIVPAPDSHIEFICQHPQTFLAYLEGEQPDLREPAPKPTLWQRLTGRLPLAPVPAKVPEDWPTTECMIIAGVANHRNVDLFHRILNGTDEFVSGSGSLFQTWLESGDTRKHTALDLTNVNENFAFKSDQVGELAGLLSQVNMDKVRDGFQHWLRQQGESDDVSDEECADILEEFQRFAEIAKKAIEQSKGIMVIAC